LRFVSVKNTKRSFEILVVWATPLRRSSYSNGGGSPVIVALKVTLPPTTADWLSGWATKDGTKNGGGGMGRNGGKSEVLPEASIEVAVTRQPGVRPLENLMVNGTEPSGAVARLVRPRNRNPSPAPAGSQSGLAKNSSV